MAADADFSGRIRVIDGDTFDMTGQARSIRLHGIDAPEHAQTCTRADGVVWACGQWVTGQVRALYDGRKAHCTAVTTDRYDRIVARCSVAGEDIGRRLVSDGLAFAYRKYSMAYDLDEKGAKVNARGLHGSTLQPPAAYRQSVRAGSAPAGADARCTIKGNISSRGARIYHLPGQEHYAATRISPGKGERWFCSEAEARAAGWRRARR